MPECQMLRSSPRPPSSLSSPLPCPLSPLASLPPLLLPPNPSVIPYQNCATKQDKTRNHLVADNLHASVHHLLHSGHTEIGDANASGVSPSLSPTLPPSPSPLYSRSEPVQQ